MQCNAMQWKGGGIFIGRPVDRDNEPLPRSQSPRQHTAAPAPLPSHSRQSPSSVPVTDTRTDNRLKNTLTCCTNWPPKYATLTQERNSANGRRWISTPLLKPTNKSEHERSSTDSNAAVTLTCQDHCAAGPHHRPRQRLHLDCTVCYYICYRIS